MYHTETFPVNERLALSLAMKFLRENLQMFRVSDRRDMYVYHATTSVYYLKLKEVNTGNNSGSILLEVYGLSPLSDELKEMFRVRLATTIATETAQTLGKMLIRNPHFKIQPYDLAFIKRNSPDSPEVQFALEVPPSVTDPLYLLLLFRHNIASFMRQLHVAPQLEASLTPSGAISKAHEIAVSQELHPAWSGLVAATSTNLANDQCSAKTASPVFFGYPSVKPSVDMSKLDPGTTPVYLRPEDFAFYLNTTKHGMETDPQFADIGTGIAVGFIYLANQNEDKTETTPITQVMTHSDVADFAEGALQEGENESHVDEREDRSGPHVSTACENEQDVLTRRLPTPATTSTAQTLIQHRRHSNELSWRQQFGTRIHTLACQEETPQSERLVVVTNLWQSGQVNLRDVVQLFKAAFRAAKEEYAFETARVEKELDLQVSKSGSELLVPRQLFRESTVYTAPSFSQVQLPLNSNLFLRQRMLMASILSSEILQQQPDLCQLLAKDSCKGDRIELVPLDESLDKPWDALSLCPSPDSVLLLARPSISFETSQADIDVDAVEKLRHYVQSTHSNSFSDGVKNFIRFSNTYNGVVRDPSLRATHIQITGTPQGRNTDESTPTFLKKRSSYAMLEISQKTIAATFYNWSVAKQRNISSILSFVTRWFNVREEIVRLLLFQRLGGKDFYRVSSDLGILLHEIRTYLKLKGTSQDWLAELELLLKNECPPEVLLQEITKTEEATLLNEATASARRESRANNFRATDASRMRGLAASRLSSRVQSPSTQNHLGSGHGLSSTNSMVSLGQQSNFSFDSISTMTQQTFGSSSRGQIPPVAPYSGIPVMAGLSSSSSTQRLQHRTSAGASSIRSRSSSLPVPIDSGKSILVNLDWLNKGQGPNTLLEDSLFSCSVVDPVAHFGIHMLREAQYWNSLQDDFSRTEELVARWTYEWNNHHDVPHFHYSHGNQTRLDECWFTLDELAHLIKHSRVVYNVRFPTFLEEHNIGDKLGDTKFTTFNEVRLVRILVDRLVSRVGMRLLKIAESEEESAAIESPSCCYLQKVVKGIILLAHLEIRKGTLIYNIRMVESHKGPSEVKTRFRAQHSSRNTNVEKNRLGACASMLKEIRNSLNIASITYGFHIAVFRQTLSAFRSHPRGIACQVFHFTDFFKTVPTGCNAAAMRQEFPFMAIEEFSPKLLEEVFLFVVERARRYGMEGLPPLDRGGQSYLFFSCGEKGFLASKSHSSPREQTYAVTVRLKQSGNKGGGHEYVLDICILSGDESILSVSHNGDSASGDAESELDTDIDDRDGVEDIEDHVEPKVLNVFEVGSPMSAASPTTRGLRIGSFGSTASNSTSQENHLSRSPVAASLDRLQLASKEDYQKVEPSRYPSSTSLEKVMDSVALDLHKVFSHSVLQFQRKLFWEHLKEHAKGPSSSGKLVETRELQNLSFRCLFTDLDPDLETFLGSVVECCQRSETPYNLHAYLCKFYGKLALRGKGDYADDVVILPDPELGFNCVAYINTTATTVEEMFSLCFYDIRLSARGLEDCRLFLTSLVQTLSRWLWTGLKLYPTR